MKEENVIQYSCRKLENNFPIEKQSNIANKESQNPKSKLSIPKKIWIPIVIIIGLVLLFIIGYLIHLKLKKKVTPPEEPTFLDNIILSNPLSEEKEVDGIYSPDLGPLDVEFVINTTLNIVKKIRVIQKSKEEKLVEGKSEENFLYRMTDYNVIFFQERMSEDYQKNFFNKTFIGAIAVSSECFSYDKEECEPAQYIDLNDQDTSNLKNLEEITDLKDLPVPLCLFEMTDNNVIVSLSCPESLSKGRKDTIVLDLYFFKPPSIQRPNKGKGVIINVEQKGDKIYIRDIDIGKCSIKNPILSNCTTDFNLTTDLSGNVLNYEELCFSNITSNEKNNYIKNKITKLTDVTNDYQNINSEKYKENLNKFLPLLYPYMKNEQLFNFSQFKELYNTVKNVSSYNKKRSLDVKKNNIVKTANLFTYNDGKTEYSINLNKNLGIYDDHFEFLNDFKAGIDTYNLNRLREYTNFDSILNKLSVLYEIGYKFAEQLYDSIKPELYKLNDIITYNITEINNMIVYQDLLRLFDSSLSIKNLTSLPLKAVEFSDNLINKLDNILNNLLNEDLKKYFEEFKYNITTYIRKSHDSVFKIEDNLKNLMSSLDSKKSVLTIIASYYMNNIPDSPNSYSDLIFKIQDILMNYYKNENNSILSKTQNLFGNFENRLLNSIKSEAQKINDLLPKLEENSTEIESGTEEDSQKLIANLKNSKNYIFTIISRIKENIMKSLGLKDNNYFISSDEINSNENSFINLITNANYTANKFDNNEYIDKIFDNIMTNFKVNVTETNNYIDNLKENIFTLNENNLKNDYFSSSGQIASDIRDLYVQISLKLKKEKDFYKSELEEKLEAFLKDNKEQLQFIINNLTIEFSEEKLKTLSDLYNSDFEQLNITLNNKVEQNNELAKNYFKELTDVISNNTKVTEILHDYMDGKLPYKREEWSDTHYVYLKSHEESIYSKKLTKAYLTKYDNFKKNLKNTFDFIKESLFKECLNIYKDSLRKLRQLLQTVKNTKISDLYPDFIDLKFTDDNIKKIDTLYVRLNKYISDDLFNDNYISKINLIKNKQLAKIQVAMNYIEDSNKKIQYDTVINDISNDFCYNFVTKAFYTCTNGQLSYDIPSDDNYCLHLSKYSENDKKIEAISIDNINNNSFISKFNSFYSSIETIVNSYDSIMKNLTDILSSVKSLTIEQKITKDYLLPFDNFINDLLKKKYGDNLIISSYEFFKNDTKTKLQNLLENIGDKWDNIFDSTNEEIKDNINNINSGIFELGVMEQIIVALINSNITNNFYESIINHQKNELDYTISYYYNYLLKIIKSGYKFIINGIPTDKNGFNDILNLRKNEINEFFGNLINKINDLKDKSCSKGKQLEVLQINEEDYFDINDVLNETIKKSKESLTEKAMYPFNFATEHNEYSFINRFYLENSLIGKSIKELYKEIENNSFIKLKVDEFINLIKENFLFDKDEYINKIVEIINNLELNIEKSFLEEKKNYVSVLEEKITEFFTEDEMIQEINDLYKNGITELEDGNITEINNNVDDILNKIKLHISNEANTLLTTAVSFTNDYSLIQKTLNDYKKDIFNELNTTFMSVVQELHLEIREKLLKEYVEAMLNLYLQKTIEYTAGFSVLTTLNNTYNTTDIIINIIKDLCIEYKNITEMQIESKYKDYVNEIKNKLDLDGIRKRINNEIDNEYNSTLFPALKKVAIFNPGDEDYKEFDFNDLIKNEIKETIKMKINKISETIFKTKGYKNNNLEITLDPWEYSFDDSSIYTSIENSIKVFITSEKTDEIDYFKNNINEFCITNFNELVSEIILSFGKDFFNRIIKYNDNFKITDLYNNLKYSIFQTISYYIMINLVEEIHELPKDLKKKLYTLNNIDLIAKEKNNQVLKILDRKIDEFINESKEKTITLFISNIQEYIIKENIFDYDINELLIQVILNLNEDPQINDNYISLLNDNFKGLFINSYTNSMNKQLKELLGLVNEQKVVLKAEIDYCFTLEPEEVLNEINDKFNITLESVNEYNDNYYDGFIISEDFYNYLSNYGNNIIQPLYGDLINLLDESTRNLILTNIDKNIKIFEDNFNIDGFNDFSNEVLTLSKEIFEKIGESVNIYGIENYKDNLNKEILDSGLRNRRRLNDDIDEKSDKKNDEGISTIFNKLLGYSENLTILMNDHDEFHNFKNNISDNLNNLEESFKKSKKLIIKNNYDEEITNNLTEKLNHLKNISSDYYYSINKTFDYLKLYLNSSISKIYDLLNQCEIITYKTFSEKYENISKEVQTLDKEYNNNSVINPIIHNISWENNNIMATAIMNNLKNKGKFHFYYKYEKGSTPIMRVELIDECKPEDLKLEIEELYGDCGKNVEEVIVNFEKVNITFTTLIDYNILLNKINVTTITKFDSYDYDTYKYKMGMSQGTICRIVMGIPVCTGDNSCKMIGTRKHNEITKDEVSYNENAIFTP